MPPRGVAMMIAPDVGPDPVPVRTSPITSSTRSASRTLDRPTPSRAGELALGRKPIAGREAAVEEVGLDVLEHDLPRARTGCGRGSRVHGRVDASSSCGLTTVACGQTTRRTPPRVS